MVSLFTITKNKIEMWGPMLWQCTYWFHPQNLMRGQNTKQIQKKTNPIKAHSPYAQLIAQGTRMLYLPYTSGMN